MGMFDGKLETTFHRTSEIPQQTKMRMAMAQRYVDTIKTKHTFFLCRDFFNDVLFWEAAKDSTSSIYGFKHNYKTNPIDRTKTTILLDLDETTLSPSEYIESASKLFAILEKGLAIDKTVFTEITGKNTKKAVLVEGDPVWQKCAPLISIYTCFLRLAARASADWKKMPWSRLIESDVSNEARYLRSCGAEPSQKLFRSAPKWVDLQLPGLVGWKPDAPISLVHNMGFQTFLQDVARPNSTSALKESCHLFDIYATL